MVLDKPISISESETEMLAKSGKSDLATPKTLPLKQKLKWYSSHNQPKRRRNKAIVDEYLLAYPKQRGVIARLGRKYGISRQRISEILRNYFNGVA